jgi:serine/threonine protein phosphatase PrpC
VSDEELLKIVNKESPGKACEKLIELANKRGGHDNITIQILKVSNQRSE